MDKSQLKIMVIEDDFIVGQNLVESLNDMGYQMVQIAHNDQEALSMFLKFSPDLCLTDIRLEGSQLDGIGIMEKLGATSNLLVIFLSAYSDYETRERIKNAKPFTFLVKPASQAQIDIAIDMAFHNFYQQPKAEKSNSFPLFSGNKKNLFIKVQNRYEKLNIIDIIFIKAEGAYSKIFTTSRQIAVCTSLQHLLDALASQLIRRTHRSFAVNVDHILFFDQQFLYLLWDSELMQIPLSDTYKGYWTNYIEII